MEEEEDVFLSSSTLVDSSRIVVEVDGVDSSVLGTVVEGNKE